MCGSLRLLLHKPQVTISRPHASTPQPSVVVTHLHTNCSSFYLHRRYGSQSQVCPLQGSNPDLLPHERTCVGAADVLTNWASQTHSSMAYYSIVRNRAYFANKIGGNRKHDSRVTAFFDIPDGVRRHLVVVKSQMRQFCFTPYGPTLQWMVFTSLDIYIANMIEIGQVNQKLQRSLKI